jgi:hypothetical protein
MVVQEEHQGHKKNEVAQALSIPVMDFAFLRVGNYVRSRTRLD